VPDCIWLYEKEMKSVTGVELGLQENDLIARAAPRHEEDIA